MVSYYESSNHNVSNNQSIISLLSMIPTLFNRIITINETNGLITKSPFDSNKSKIQFEDYINRLVKHTEVESNTLLFSLMLLDKFSVQSEISFSKLNIHKLFLISLIISIKFLEDVIFEERDYALIAGVNKKELAYLEQEFLIGIDYRVSIDETKFKCYYKCFLSGY